jgi:Tol biopolymer transport system component/tRNA A-37 threonylcarbamoyl transferase component Bud32
MALTAGTSLSHYRLVTPIGEGGMGVVWRATDSNLGRDVAIKVLPDLFAADPERLARFEREARLLASLNHPHVASIFGLDSAGGLRFLAMELVEGENLAERLERGPIPLGEALPIALQIAQALEHAHERGIVHRDLKPANVKLTASGEAKVLDFGLAKALEGDPTRPTSSVLLQQSPTITAHMTGANVLLGTAAYMAPEQARGQVTDRRADIWAFGVVLMEMLTGQRLFPGDTISDTLAAVLRVDLDWNSLPADTPPRIRKLLQRCLERDAKRRLRDIGEARITLEEVLAGVPDEPAAATVPAAAPPTLAKRALPWIAAGVFGLLLGAGVMMLAGGGGRSKTAAPLTKFRLSLPADVEGAPTYPTIAPDGRSIAYLQSGSLWIQALGELDPRKFPVEPNASRLFWSPDAKQIGYLAGTRIYRTTLGGAENQLVCDTRGAISSGGWGATWREDGSIVYSRGDTAGLLVVAAKGGDPHPLLRPDTTETDFHEPWALPGDRGILFAAHRRIGGINALCLWTRKGRSVLLELPGQTIYTPCYSPTGHILFRRSPTTPGIWALPFSLERLEATGEPFIVSPLGANPTVATDGTLAYIHQGAGGMTEMFWTDRSGKVVGTIGTPEADASLSPSLSPDGTSAIRSILAGGNRDLWRFDTQRGTRTRLTFDPAGEDAAVFSPSGDRIAYHATLAATSVVEGYRIVTRRADGTGDADTLASAGATPLFTPDGQKLIYIALPDNAARWDLTEIGVAPGTPPRVLVRGNPWAYEGRVSPSGDLMAYMSSESGRWEVFLTRYPSCEGKWQVSTAGGQWPRWDASGRRLYYAEGDRILEVEVTHGAAPVLATPTLLFTRPPTSPGTFSLVPNFEVTRDGQRFLLTRAAGTLGSAQGPTVVQNWLAEFAEAEPK